MAEKLEVLAKLVSTIASRSGADPSTSYTAKILSQGVEKCAKKFGEEAFELALASVSSDKKQVTAEAGDVLYHFLVLLKAAGVEVSDVMAELERREAQSGLEEKASRGSKG